MDLITKRPRKMSFRDYKTHQKEEKKWLKGHKKGRFVYIERILKVREVGGKKIEFWETHGPFRGSVKFDLKKFV